MDHLAIGVKCIGGQFFLVFEKGLDRFTEKNDPTLATGIDGTLSSSRVDPFLTEGSEPACFLAGLFERILGKGTDGKGNGRGGLPGSRVAGPDSIGDAFLEAKDTASPSDFEFEAFDLGIFDRIGSFFSVKPSRPFSNTRKNWPPIHFTPIAK